MRGLNVSRVLNGAPRQLREGFAELESALSLHLEPTLLRHGGVKSAVKSAGS